MLRVPRISVSYLPVFIGKIISSDSFVRRHKKRKKDFARNRIFSFQILFLFLANILRSSYQNELDNFFKIIKKKTIPLRIVTKSAITQARKKLKHTAFIEIIKKMNDYFYENYNYKTWKGFRLIAIDGSTLTLPKSKKLRSYFGTIKANNGRDKIEPVTLASISSCFDLLNKITIDTTIEKYKADEREMAIKHMQYLGRNDLIIADRGYPSFPIFKQMEMRNLNFCFRIASNADWKIMKRFANSKKETEIITLFPSYQAKKKTERYDINPVPIKIRLVKVKLNNKEIEVLATSLLDLEKYPNSIFKKLYALRWGIETYYHLLKERVELENFSGKSVLAIKQDFYAKSFIVNFTEMLSKPAIEVIESQNKKKAKKYQINRTQALAKMKHFFLVFMVFKNIKNVLSEFINMLIQDKEIVRPGRKFKREIKKLSKKYYFNLKPIC